MKYFFVLLITLLAVGCTKMQSTPSSDTNVFDLKSYLIEFKSQNPQLSNASRISWTGDHRDTISYLNYQTDSLIRILEQFTMSKREQAGEFEVKSSKSEKTTCEEFRPKDEIDIKSLVVCYQDEMINSISSQKLKNTLLNSMHLQIHFDPASSLELLTTFVDKISNDTLTSGHILMWQK